MTAFFILYILLFASQKTISDIWGDLPYLSIFLQQFIGVFLPLFIYYSFIKKEKYLEKRDFKINPLHIPLLFITGFCLQLFGSFINYPVVLFLDKMGVSAPSSAPVPDGLEIILYILTVCCLPAVTEEVFFRKYTYGVIEPFGKIRASVAVALIFAVVHLNAYSIVPLIMVGLILSYLRYRQIPLIYTILLHFSLNFSGILLDLITKNEILNTVLNNYFLLFNIVAACFIIGFIVFINRIFNGGLENA